MRRVLDRLFTLERWRIGWARADVLDFLEQPSSVRFEWIDPARPDESLANPFGDERAGRCAILAERLRWGEPGTIVRIDPERGGGVADALATGWHLSRPFLVEDDGSRWVCPEQAEIGRVALYRVQPDGSLSPQDRVELMHLDLRDPTFVRHDGRWWLFGTLEPSETEQQLVLYYADRLTGPWRAHPKNPIATGFENCRPAGRIIARDGRLLRPAQDSSTTYGGAVVINQVLSLTPDDYRERPLQRISPRDVAGAGEEGLHHVDHTASYVFVDSKSIGWHPLAWWLKPIHKRRRAARVAARALAAQAA